MTSPLYVIGHVNPDTDSIAAALGYAWLGTRSPLEVVSTDLKVYQTGDFNFSISQVEVSDHYELDEHIPLLRNALVDLKNGKGLDFTILMVTDVVENSSRLLLCNAPQC